MDIISIDHVDSRVLESVYALENNIITVDQLLQSNTSILIRNTLILYMIINDIVNEQAEYTYLYYVLTEIYIYKESTSNVYDIFVESSALPNVVRCSILEYRTNEVSKHEIIISVLLLMSI